jgi:hypothetical protein
MKCQSKIDVSIPKNRGSSENILIYGNIYEYELAPTTYDPNTYKLAKPSYVVKCEDGKFRKYDAEHFRDIQEVREQKLKELGI